MFPRKETFILNKTTKKSQEWFLSYNGLLSEIAFCWSVLDLCFALVSLFLTCIIKRQYNQSSVINCHALSLSSVIFQSTVVEHE